MISFHYPANLWLFVPFAVAVMLSVWSRWKRRRDFERLGDWRLLQRLLPVEALYRRRWKDWLALAALALVVFAAAGPQFGSSMKEVKQRGVDVFIAVDVSRSMLAEDVAPSRLERAKRSLGLLVKKLDGNRIGIIAFAKFALIQCPLTVDNDAVGMFLDILDQNTVPQQGTGIGDAIRLAVASFPKNEKTGRALVLLTDGEDHRSDPVGAAQAAKDAGVVIFTIGIGTTKGEVIKDRDEQGNVTEFHKYKGEMVVSRMDDALLTKIAQITGGQYYRASSTDKEIDDIAEALNGFDKQQFASRVFERLEERYQWFLAPGLLLMIFEFLFAERRGQMQRLRTTVGALRRRREKPAAKQSSKTVSAAIVALLLLFAGATSARADYQDHLREGNRLLQKKDLQGARKEFESAQIDAPELPFAPFNIAITYHLEGNFDEAKRAYEQALSLSPNPILKSRVLYNLGHLAFDQGNSAEALEQFKACLRLNPKDMDAKYNVEYIRSGKKPRAQPNSKPNDKNGSSGDKSKDNAGQQGDKDKNSSDKDGEQKKDSVAPAKGDLSKEDAERVLQMMQDQEKERMKGQVYVPNKPPKDHDKKTDEGGEDW